jgi:hypothetical protein
VTAKIKNINYYLASTPLMQSDDANSLNQRPAVKGVGDDFLLWNDPKNLNLKVSSLTCELET